MLLDYLFVTAGNHWGCCKAARCFVKFQFTGFFIEEQPFELDFYFLFPLTVTSSLSCLMEKTAKSVVSAQIFSSLAHSTIIIRDNVHKLK